MRRSFTAMTDTERAEFIRSQADELQLYAINTGDLYPRFLAIIRTTVKRYRNTGDERKAYWHLERGLRSWMGDAIHSYHFEIDRHSDDGLTWFPAESIRLAVTELANAEMQRIKAGEYDDIIDRQEREKAAQQAREDALIALYQKARNYATVNTVMIRYQQECEALQARHPIAAQRNRSWNAYQAATKHAHDVHADPALIENARVGGMREGKSDADSMTKAELSAYVRMFEQISA